MTQKKQVAEMSAVAIIAAAGLHIRDQDMKIADGQPLDLGPYREEIRDRLQKVEYQAIQEAKRRERTGEQADPSTAAVQEHVLEELRYAQAALLHVETLGRGWAAARRADRILSER